MALVELSYALTSVDKVNAMLGFTTGADVTRDQLLADLIAATTDYIESYCGGRRFLQTTYTETLDVRRGNYIFMNQRPVASITSVKYRTGLPSSPTWVTYYVDGYIAYLGSGMIRFFSKFVPFPQAFQVTYTAGYLISWANFMDPTLHTLPRDLSLVCAEITIGKYNTRLAQGILREETEGQKVEYANDKYLLSNDHKNVLEVYKINRVSSVV